MDFLNEQVLALVGIVLALFVASLTDFVKKRLAKLWLAIIHSRHTPNRLKSGEEKAMKLGVMTGIIAAKEKAYASNIYLFAIRRNGHDTLQQLMKADDVSELSGLDVKGFERVFEALKLDKFIVIKNTDKPENKDYAVFCDVLQSMGYKSVNLLFIENKYRFAFYMIVHRSNRLTSVDDVELLKKNLLQWGDPITTLYLKKK